MFFPGVFSVIMSINIDPHLRQVWNYIWASMCETGQIRAGPAQIVSNTAHLLTNKPYKGKVCDNSLLEKDQSISSFDWKTFDLVFKLYAVMLLVPGVILLMEMHKKVNRRVCSLLVQEYSLRDPLSVHGCHLVHRLSIIVVQEIFNSDSLFRNHEEEHENSACCYSVGRDESCTRRLMAAVVTLGARS